MANPVPAFIRIWRTSPSLAFAWFRRKMVRSAKALIPIDDWKSEWLGEEARPYLNYER